MEFIKKNGRLVVAYCLVLSFLCLFFDCGAYNYSGHLDNPTTGFEMIFGKCRRNSANEKERTLCL